MRATRRKPYGSFRPIAVAFAGFAMAAVAGGSALADNPLVEPTMTGVRYGPHERHTLDLWKAESSDPTPVLINIHGGGWVRGDGIHQMHLYPFLGRGVSVVTIRYRLANKATGDRLPAPLLDAARAIQFVRHKADEWGLNKERLAVMGSSAGGCSSLWLALHDDLADPDNDDPVLRESTKPLCALANAAQTFIDVNMVVEHVGPKGASHRMIWETAGADSSKDAIERYEEFADVYRECSPLNHLDKGDPPILLYYKYGGDNIHSSRFGDKLLEQAQETGAPVYMFAPENSVPPPAPYEGRWDFIYKQLLAER